MSGVCFAASVGKPQGQRTPQAPSLDLVIHRSARGYLRTWDWPKLLLLSLEEKPEATKYCCGMFSGLRTAAVEYPLYSPILPHIRSLFYRMAELSCAISPFSLFISSLVTIVAA